MSDKPGIPRAPQRHQIFLQGLYTTSFLKLSAPTKAPGQDKIPNVIYTKCMDALIDHIFFYLQGNLRTEHVPPSLAGEYHTGPQEDRKDQLQHSKIVRPIGLIDTLPKGFSTLNAKHISFLAEKHNMLPQTQFGVDLGATQLTLCY